MALSTPSHHSFTHNVDVIKKVLIILSALKLNGNFHWIHDRSFHSPILCELAFRTKWINFFTSSWKWLISKWKMHDSYTNVKKWIEMNVRFFRRIENAIKSSLLLCFCRILNFSFPSKYNEILLWFCIKFIFVILLTCLFEKYTQNRLSFYLV